MNGIRLAAWCLVLSLMGGCREKEQPQAVQPSKPSVTAQRDVDADAGSAASEKAKPSPTPAVITQAPSSVPPSSVPPLQVVPDLSLRPIDSVEAFVRERAQEEGWDLSEEDLKHYWRSVATLKDEDLGQFILGRLSNSSLPLGSDSRSFILLREYKGKWSAYGTLIDQVPATPRYQHEVLSPKMAFQPVAGYSGKLLWIQLQDKLKTRLDESGERLDINSILLGYGFLVDASGGFTPVAFKLPEIVSHQVGDADAVETRLLVSVPSAKRVNVAAGPGGANPEQKAWIGSHPIGR